MKQHSSVSRCASLDMNWRDRQSSTATPMTRSERATNFGVSFARTPTA